ncbi:porin family protein, partial [bacterium]|nr:porin family protein [bacterium]
ANNNTQTAVLSDFLGESTGEWDIPGLPTGNWFLVINEISGTIYPAWIEDDGVGSNAHTYTGFPEEHYDTDESNHDNATDKNSLPVWSNWNTRNVNMITNEGTLPDLSIRPWGVDQAPPAPPWYKSPDIWVDNDGDGNVNEINEPERGISNNQLSAQITNIGNAGSSVYKVSFSFRPYTTNAAAPLVAIQSVNELTSLASGVSKTYTVNWDLTDAFIQANFPSQFWSADHFCVKVEIEPSGILPLSDANPFNNATQSNYGSVPVAPSPGGFSKARFFLYNHHNNNANASLMWVASKKGWSVSFEGIENIHHISMKPKEWIEVTAVLAPQPGTPPIKVDEPVLVDISQRLNGIIVGGVTLALQAPAIEIPYRKFSLSIHGGIAVPIDNFADDFEQGYNVLVDLDYHFTQQLSFVGFFGYNDFKSKTAGIDDNYWMNVSANIKYREQLRPQLFFYFNGGPGYYIPETGDSRFGLNLGAGFNYDYTNTINFELGADYHTIFDEGIQFVHSHAGLILRF